MIVCTCEYCRSARFRLVKRFKNMVVGEIKFWYIYTYIQGQLKFCFWKTACDQEESSPQVENQRFKEALQVAAKENEPKVCQGFLTSWMESKMFDTQKVLESLIQSCFFICFFGA